MSTYVPRKLLWQLAIKYEARQKMWAAPPTGDPREDGFNYGASQTYKVVARELRDAAKPKRTSAKRRGR